MTVRQLRKGLLNLHHARHYLIQTNSEGSFYYHKNYPLHLRQAEDILVDLTWKVWEDHDTLVRSSLRYKLMSKLRGWYDRVVYCGPKGVAVWCWLVQGVVLLGAWAIGHYAPGWAFLAAFLLTVILPNPWADSFRRG